MSRIDEVVADGDGRTGDAAGKKTAEEFFGGESRYRKRRDLWNRCLERERDCVWIFSETFEIQKEGKMFTVLPQVLSLKLY